MKVYIDQNISWKEIRDLKQRYDFDAIHHQNLEQPVKATDPEEGVGVWDESLWDSGDYWAGDDGLLPELQRIIGNSNDSDKRDVAHIYTAYHSKCDYFVTNNPNSFIYESRRNKGSDKKRQDLENLLRGLKVVTLDEFISILEKTCK